MKLKDYEKKKMQDPEFAKAYEEIQPEMNVIRAMIEARTSQNLTQEFSDMLIQKRSRSRPMIDVSRTKDYYCRLNAGDLFQCAYCRNYMREIRAAYPEIAAYLSELGVDAEKPFERIRILGVA